MAIELMTPTRRKLLLLVVMSILAVSMLGAADVTNELVSQPNETTQKMRHLQRLSESMASETSIENREGWVRIAREQPAAFLSACSQ